MCRSLQERQAAESQLQSQLAGARASLAKAEQQCSCLEAEVEQLRSCSTEAGSLREETQQLSRQAQACTTYLHCI